MVLTAPGYVLDSWPVLEWLQAKTPVSATFVSLVDDCVQTQRPLLMSRINYGEVVYMLAKNLPEVAAAEALRRFRTFPIELVSVDDDLIDEAAAIKSKYRLAYADTFAAALAIRLTLPLVTGDPEFLALQDAGLLTVEWLGA